MAENYMTARGWIFEDERKFLHEQAAETAKRFPAPRIVNIGVEYGASLHCLRAGAPEATIYGVDLNIDKFEGDVEDFKLIKGDSSDSVTSRKVHRPVHMLFIDGDHSYDGVYQDLSRWADKVVVGGLVILHDHVESKEHPKWNPGIDEVAPALADWLVEQPEGRWVRIDCPTSLGAIRREKE